MLFRDLLKKSEVCIFLDDILIATNSVEGNLQILGKVLKVLKENRLQLRMDKCCFLMASVDFLGYTVSSEGITPCEEHVQSVQRFPIPRNPKDLHSFLGLIGYFRRFIKDLAQIAKPLFHLIRKGVTFNFGEVEYKILSHCKIA